MNIRHSSFHGFIVGKDYEPSVRIKIIKNSGFNSGSITRKSYDVNKPFAVNPNLKFFTNFSINVKVSEQIN